MQTMRYYSKSNLPLIRGTAQSAGLDLPFYDENNDVIIIHPAQRVKLLTGVHVEIPDNYFGLLDSRSSTSKLDLSLLCRTIDSDYRGEISLVFINCGKNDVFIRKGQYLAQLIILPCELVIQESVDDLSKLSETKRGCNGFGHTGNTGEGVSYEKS